MEGGKGHLSDEQVIRVADRELRSGEVREHLEECPECRQRLLQFTQAAREFERLHRASRSQSEESPSREPLPKRQVRNFASAAAVLVLAVAIWMAAPASENSGIPRPDLTPGAVRNVALAEVCGSGLGSNAKVAPAVARMVFEEYGVNAATAGAYEVDYLITPVLGGSNDIKNLWPQPYQGPVWSAYIKDALEERLREMVCAGELDLATAQREIAENWIAAYKKYFHTSRPLAAHARPRE